MRLPNISLATSTLIVICSLACAITLFLIVRIVYRNDPKRRTALHWLEVRAAFSLLGLAVLGVLVYVAGVVGFGTFFVTLVILIMAHNQHLANQRLALLELIALAAERKMPLATAVTAFAYERGRPHGWPAMCVGEQLEAGQPLSIALEQNKRALPRSALLAARVGEDTGQLGLALRELATRDAFRPPVWHASMGRFLYLSWFTLGFAPTVLAFMAIKIGPMMQKIFDDFGAELPPITAMVLRISNGATYRSVVSLCLLAGNIWLLMLVAVYMFGWQLSLPGTGWFTRGLHRTVVLRALALGASARRTLPDIMGVLIEGYPTPSIRRRLLAAQTNMTGGMPWTDSLRRVGLIGTADAAVLTSAQRVGNLPWALEEMAESNERRLNYQLQTLIQIAFPICVVAIGMLVAFCVVGYFLPLVKLITDMSG